ncbi:hypothetical protein A8L34_29525 [Bacillus sp. FJAT-27264]|uniref:hypothetical protein n=1 Tax=Paenibacillus sp. (strain DSM 101736 / FJAT-27264) TaxID=1850362 RepID=UPI0008080E90|nr:hypothetical protein [Bacillus sp. FJAT-27264]OBZ15201.1 hypothetical protein A8L34_29525 [Bacillus sp. FJAT-27264]
MSSVTGSTQVRIGTGVKLELESYRDNFLGPKSTHSDAVERLLSYYASSEKEKAADHKAADLEKKRRGYEDVTLGRDRKELLTVFQEKYGLPDLNAMLDVMLHHFETSDSLSKVTVDLLLSLRK